MDPTLYVILRRLIRRSFPHVRRRPIDIYWGGGEDDELLLYHLEHHRHSIRVNATLRAAPRRVIEGGIAHELCHIARDLRLGRHSRDLSWEKYDRCRWARMREERAVEREAVALGYAPHLLAFWRYAHCLGWRFAREHGLLYTELLTTIRTPSPGRGTPPRA